jgi:hypothetical protein
MIELRQRRGPKLYWYRACWLLPTAAALFANTAQAFTSSSIEWDAPAACPSAAALSERLSTLLGGDDGALGGVTRVRGVVSKEAAGYRVVLEVAEAERRSSRAFSAQDCADLMEAAALAIALTVHAEEPAAAASATEVPRSREVSSTAADVGSPALGSAASEPGVRWSAGAEGVLDTGALPAVAPGVSVLGRARLEALSLDVHATLFPKQRLGVGQSDRVEFDLLLIGLRACDRLFDRNMSAAACAGFEAGQLNASGGTLSPARQLHDLWLAPALALEAGQRLGSSWQLSLRGEALAPLRRKQYIINENERVHAPSSVDLRLSLGLRIGAD